MHQELSYEGTLFVCTNVNEARAVAISNCLVLRSLQVYSVDGCVADLMNKKISTKIYGIILCNQYYTDHRVVYKG